MKLKWMFSISICIMVLVQLSAGEYIKECDLNGDGKINIEISTQELQREEKSKKQPHKKYNEEEMENPEFITASEFDEWLKVNDYYEVFVNVYNSSSSHSYVEKIKCMFELDSLFNGEMEFESLEEKCSNQK